MTTTLVDLLDIPFEERTFEQVRDHYYRKFPLLREYEELTSLHNGSSRTPINEPWEGGLDTMRVTEMALIRSGKPPRDRDDILHAEQYITGLQREMRDQYPAKDPDLAEAVILAEFQWAGCVTHADDFEAMSDAEKAEHVDAVISELTGDTKAHLREALLIALPTLYRRITAQDQDRRRKLGLSVVPRT